MQKLPLQIAFGAEGDYKPFAGDGWHPDDPGSTYTWASHNAILEMPIEPVNVDLTLELDVIPAPAEGVRQELFVFVNGSFVAFFSASEAGAKTATLEARFFTEPRTIFTFVMPRAVRLSDRGQSSDHRLLGLAFRSITLAKVKPASKPAPRKRVAAAASP